MEISTPVIIKLLNLMLTKNNEDLPSYKYIYGQGSQKLYNWPNIVSPPHYRNDVHHPHDIICLYCRGHQDESEYIYFYIVYVSHLSSIDEYCRTFGSNTVILACLQTHIAHSILLHKKSINCNQTIYDSIRKLSYCNCFLSAFVCLKDMFP